ncbi:MAG TPA: DMT family transporter [Burkholderiales bacterium]|nr:DMT family transporter [Burkholderiales bacterium]
MRTPSRGRTVSANPPARKLSLRVGIPILLAASTLFASNHVGARLAFDHGASVATGVVVRATATALVLLALITAQGVPLALPRHVRLPALLTGLCAAVQSYCLYSAVARIPVALALLVFHTAPILFVLLSWAMGHERLRASSFAAMLVALAGLALALNIRVEGFAERWAEIGAGVSWALGGSVSFMLMLYSNAHALKEVDGRVRTFVMTAVTALIVVAAGAATHAFALPKDSQGWLGLGLLAMFYCGGMFMLFMWLPRLVAASTVALNFEPIALLGLGWMVLGQVVAPVQVAGAFFTVGAIAWLGSSKK